MIRSPTVISLEALGVDFLPAIEALPERTLPDPLERRLNRAQ
jgi:hypothetical protein